MERFRINVLMGNPEIGGKHFTNKAEVVFLSPDIKCQILVILLLKL